MGFFPSAVQCELPGEGGEQYRADERDRDSPDTRLPRDRLELSPHRVCNVLNATGGGLSIAVLSACGGCRSPSTFHKWSQWFSRKRDHSSQQLADTVGT